MVLGDARDVRLWFELQDCITCLEYLPSFLLASLHLGALGDQKEAIVVLELLVVVYIKMLLVVVVCLLRVGEQILVAARGWRRLALLLVEELIMEVTRLLVLFQMEMQVLLVLVLLLIHLSIGRVLSANQLPNQDHHRL